MRIGFITQLHWNRYGDFWQNIVKDTGAELVFATKEEILANIKDERLENIDNLIFKTAAAEAIALNEVNFIIAPDLNQNRDATKGGGQDPWLANFPETLQTVVKGLPAVYGVPSQNTANIQEKAIELLMSLTHSPNTAKRILNEHLAKLQIPYSDIRNIDRYRDVKALVGQAWLLDSLTELASNDFDLIKQNDIDPQILKDEAARHDKNLIDTDAEVLGACYLFSRKAAINKILFLADKNSSNDLWLNRRAKKIIHKDFETIYIQDLLSDEDLLIEIIQEFENTKIEPEETEIIAETEDNDSDNFIEPT